MFDQLTKLMKEVFSEKVVKVIDEKGGFAQMETTEQEQAIT